jgi:RNA-binding protein
MELADNQRRHLRGLAHRLKPCVHVGVAGVTPAVIEELTKALEHHELVKVRIRSSNRDARDVAVESLTRGSGAVLLSRIGNVAVLYRPHPDEPLLALPGPERRGSR